MIDAIVSGVTEKLVREFGYAVYTENSAQGSKKPCFVVSCKNPISGGAKDRRFTETQIIGNRYVRSAGLCVEFFPASKGIREECAAILDRLFLCLEYIGFGDGVLRGTGMRGEFGEDTLNFFVNYDAFVFKAEIGAEMMGQLTII